MRLYFTYAAGKHAVPMLHHLLMKTIPDMTFPNNGGKIETLVLTDQMHFTSEMFSAGVYECAIG